MTRETQTPDLDAHFQSRIDRLRDLLLTKTENLLGKGAEEQDKAFEQAVEGRLRNGAKVIPRKRQSR
jgi:hypothetical protein